ncbi:MAG: sigma-54-dependent Fis family transcriptional regulator [Cohaesibacter sp.]|jgi:transcriptional regulator of acetoin/glycerol metabolism|nr:sigma-54-dependent Fis family transcriptional regulator [Cohaesibacter sp.]
MQSYRRAELIQRDRSTISASWERCFQEYGLDQRSRRHETVVRRERVRDSIEALGPLFAACRSQVQHIFQNIVGSGHAVILTDQDGTMIDFAVQSELEALFRQSGLRRGADWSEGLEGTNGIGTAIREKRSVTVYRDQHFHSDHASLTCTGAPIFDVEGEVLALFDVSSIGRKDDVDILAHTRALLEMSARLISRRNFQDHFSDHWIIRFHQDAERVGLLEEGLLAIDHRGKVIGADEQAVKHLGVSGRKVLVDHEIEDIFAMQRDQLADNLVQGGRVSANLPLHDTYRRDQPFMHARLMEPVGPSSRIDRARPAFSRPAKARRPYGKVLKKSNDLVTARSTASPHASLEALCAADPSLQSLAHKAQRLFEHDVPLLVTGETGVGKDSFSRALHMASSRAGQPFVAVNCGALPENLIEGELFGYKAGAFTGAQEKGFKGQILAANGGTLMLDEIGDMPLSAQTRLLQVLECRKVTPLGSSEGIDLDIRLIAATHQSLEDLCAQGRFREDLYYRICGFTLTLPALRVRRDFEQLVEALTAGRMLCDPEDFSPVACEMLKGCKWPGNIRQLKHVLKTALILAEDGPITEEHLQMPPGLGLATASSFASAHGLAENAEGNRGMMEEEIPAGALRLDVRNKERERILACLREQKWNVSRAAQILCLSRNTLYRKMKALNITRH